MQFCLRTLLPGLWPQQVPISTKKNEEQSPELGGSLPLSTFCRSVTHQKVLLMKGLRGSLGMLRKATFQLPLSHIKMGLGHGTHLTKRCRGHIACAGLFTLWGNTFPCFTLNVWPAVLLKYMHCWPSGMPQLSVFQTAWGRSLGFFYCGMKWNVCSCTACIGGAGGLLASRDWCIERGHILCTLSLLSLYINPMSCESVVPAVYSKQPRLLHWSLPWVVFLCILTLAA